jgi:hypothetical protein
MIEFRKKNHLLILEYHSDLYDYHSWAIDKFEKSEAINLKRTFTFTENDLLGLDEDHLSEDDSGEHLNFILGHLDDEYFKIEGKILGISISIFFFKDMKIKSKHFTAIKNISIFRKINEVVKEDIYIGGKRENSLPISEFEWLIKNFPNTYEIEKYVDARLSSILRNYFDAVVDGEKKYNVYMNKKVSKKGDNLSKFFKESELNKYDTILKKLEEMLRSENFYNERQWQEEILQIILLLYPKYIHVFKEVPVRDIYREKNRSLDFILIDSSGNLDVVEIKRPFDNQIVTKNTYRDNYIPLRELSGTVMQIEKYLFYLNKWGKKGEDYLTCKYKKELPYGFKIKIINPGGIIVMGRENSLSNIQREDFEVIKRKYKNIIDIITYDDLLNRLKFTIEQLKSRT